MRIKVSCLAYLLLFLPFVAGADAYRLKLPSFVGLERKATETVDLTIGRMPLSILGWLMDHDDDSDPETVAIKKVIKGLKSIQIRSYQFDSDFVYSRSDIEAVRAQLTSPGWSQLIQVRDKEKNEAVDVYIAYDHDKVVGLAIVASEPREFSIVNIVGEVGLEQVATLQKHLSLPDTGATRFALRGL